MIESAALVSVEDLDSLASAPAASAPFSPVELEALELRRDLRALGCFAAHGAAGGLLAALLNGRLLPRGGDSVDVALPLFGVGARPARLRLRALCGGGGGEGEGRGDAVRVDAFATRIVEAVPAAAAFPPARVWHARALRWAPGQHRAIREVITAAAVGGGALIVGPPGAGKRFVARAVAAASARPAFVISGASLLLDEPGASEARLRSLFVALTDAAPCTVLIDGADLVLPSRPRSQVAQRCASAIFRAMDALADEGRKVTWLATVTTPTGDAGSDGSSLVSVRVYGPTRLTSTVHMGAPTPRVRSDIIGHLLFQLRRQPLAGASNDGATEHERVADYVAARTHGFTPADLSLLTSSAYEFAAKSAALRGSQIVPTAAFDAVLLTFRPSMMQHIVGSPPRAVDLSADVLGMRDVVDAAYMAVLGPLVYAAEFAAMGTSPPCGLLLHGPAGSGKTLLAHALAHTASQVLRVANALVVQGPDIVSARVGASESAIAAVFARARELRPCILVFDQFETLAPARAPPGSGSAGTSRADDRVLSMLLTEIDGVGGSASGFTGAGGHNDLSGDDPWASQSDKVGAGAGAGLESTSSPPPRSQAFVSPPMPDIIVVAVTHNRMLLDPAIMRPGRFDSHVMLTHPDFAERRALLRHCLSRSPLAIASLDASCDALAARTEGWSRASLVGLWEAAAMQALRRELSEGGSEAHINDVDVEYAFALVSRERL